MNIEDQEEALKSKLINIKNNLEVANGAIVSALENLNNFDDFVDLISNWDKYRNIFGEN